MATKKKLLQAAAGTAAASGGAGGLNVESLFSTYLYEGNGSSQTIQNGVNLGQSYGSGSARFGGTATGEYLQTPVSTDFVLGSGDFTIEFWMNVTSSSGNNQEPLSFGDGTGDYDPVFYLSGTTLQFYGSTSGTAWDLLSGVSVGTITYGTWHHVAVTRNVDGVRCYLDGVQGSGTGIGSSSFSQTSNQVTIGRGQDTKRFYGYLSDVHFVKGTALYTGSSYTLPTSATTAHANTKLLTLQQDDLLTDNSTTGHTITEYGGSIYDEPVFGPFDAAEAGEGGLVWFKERSPSTDYHIWQDTERGVGKSLFSNNDAAQSGNAGDLVASFNANGFSVNNDYLGTANTSTNGAGQNTVSWTFRKAPRFFDIQTWTGTGVARTISHNLGSVPGAILVKRYSATEDWNMYHRSLGNGFYLQLNGTGQKAVSGTGVGEANLWNDTDPTSTEFSIGTHNRVNTSGESYVAYIFAHNDGDGEFGPDGDADIIKCGSVSHTQSNGSDSFVDLGFEPQWVMVKRADDTGSWIIYDTMRSFTAKGATSLYLLANSSDAEAEEGLSDGWIALNSTGFSLLDGAWGTGDYIYIAIRRGPMAVPTDATDVFAIDTRSGTRPSFTSNFVTDFALARDASQTWEWVVAQRLTQGKIFEGTNDTDAEFSQSSFKFDYQNGYGNLVGSNSNYYGWMWQRRPNYFDVVCYTGNGTVNHQISHNLQAVPELLLFKPRGSGSWIVKSKFDDDASGVSTRTNYLLLNYTNAYSSSADYRLSSDETSFTLSTNGGFDNGSGWNASGSDYIAYLFASLDGVSKVGSFTAGVSDTFVDCGFSSSARFVLMKRSSGTGDWFVYDSERGYAAGANDKRLKLNTTDAETTNNNIDPTAGGFTVTGNTIDAGTYIFYAIA